MGKHFFGVAPIFRENRHPDAERGRGQLAVGHAVGQLHRLADPVDHAIDMRAVEERRQDHRKFVTAQPEGSINVPDRPTQTLSNRDQRGIARTVAVFIIDLLEAIDIEIDQREGRTAALGMGHRIGQHLIEQHPVAQPGQPVVGGTALQLGIFRCQAGVPALQFGQQGVEILAEAVDLGDARSRHALFEGAFLPHGVGDLGHMIERCDHFVLQPPRQDPRGHHCQPDAGQRDQQGGQHIAQDPARIAIDLNPRDQRAALAHIGPGRFGPDHTVGSIKQPGRTFVRTIPVRQAVTGRIDHLDLVNSG